MTISDNFAAELQKAISSLDKMKLEEIHGTSSSPELMKYDTTVSSSLSFSFEADSTLSLYMAEVDSLPVELQTILRDLKKKEDVLVKCNDEFMHFNQHEPKEDFLAELVQMEEKLLMLRAKWDKWHNKAKGIMNLEELENEFNCFFRPMQESIMKAEYFSGKEDFMRRAFEEKPNVGFLG